MCENCNARELRATRLLLAAMTGTPLPAEDQVLGEQFAKFLGTIMPQPSLDATEARHEAVKEEVVKLVDGIGTEDLITFSRIASEAGTLFENMGVVTGRAVRRRAEAGDAIAAEAVREASPPSLLDMLAEQGIEVNIIDMGAIGRRSDATVAH